MRTWAPEQTKVVMYPLHKFPDTWRLLVWEAGIIVGLWFSLRLRAVLSEGLSAGQHRQLPLPAFIIVFTRPWREGWDWRGSGLEHAGLGIKRLKLEASSATSPPGLVTCSWFSAPQAHLPTTLPSLQGLEVIKRVGLHTVCGGPA